MVKLQELNKKIKEKLKELGVDYLLVNATNTWLEETPPVKESAVFALTGFSGDTGDCLLFKNGDCKLFVDGRYHIQAEEEVKKGVEVVKLQVNQLQDKEICNFIDNGKILAIVSTKVSCSRLEKINEFLKGKQVVIKYLDKDPVLDLEKQKKALLEKALFVKQKILNKSKTGCKPKVFKPKVATLITDLDDVAYLTKRRDFLTKSGASRIYSYLFLDKNGRQKLLKNLKAVKKFLKKNLNTIAFNKASTSVYIASLIKNPSSQMDDVLKLRTTKTKEELKALKKAFSISDKALLATREFIEQAKSGTISEFDIYNNLIKNFKKFGASGISFEPIVAINKNSALAHYMKHSKDIFLNNGDVVLIDCGVYCKEGLATDTTRVFVKGKPNKLQKEVYTLVLKAFLNAYGNKDKTGFELNQLAHSILDEKIIAEVKTNTKNNKKNEKEFFAFNHGLGHGIGISVHEALPNLGFREVSKQHFKDGMCFTIEPGLYHKDYFGIRLENSFMRNKGDNVSLTKIGFEKKMILFDQLSKMEIKLLKNFNCL